MKQWTRTVLIAYLLFVVWLVLFKFSSDILTVIAHHQSTSINLVPFVNNRLREMFDNFVFFVPLGLLLGASYKGTSFKRKLTFVFFLSICVEITQFVLAIGMADVTDVIMNTLGGFVGLAVYDVLYRRRFMKSNRLDLVIDICITVCIAALLAAFLYFRIFVLKVRY